MSVFSNPFTSHDSIGPFGTGRLLNLEAFHQFTVVLFAIFLCSQATAQCVSVQSGDWNDPATWSCGDPPTSSVPSCSDTSIIIAESHVVEISSQANYSACPDFIVITIEGVLNIDGSGSKLRLPEGSFISGNGDLTVTNPGGGNSTSIVIGGTTVWTGSGDGDTNGPFQFPTNHPLPIELISFEGTAGIDAVYFSWEVASELNNDYFEIERSKDLETWSIVHIEPGSGTSNENRTYQGKDAFPQNGLMYYRLVQTDFNGTSENFDPIAIDFGSNGAKNAEPSLFPNPFSVSNQQALFIQNWRESIDRIIISDIRGQTIQELNGPEVVNNSFRIEIHKEAFRPGLYLMRIENSLGVKAIKFYVY